jgi:hypothetical protein
MDTPSPLSVPASLRSQRNKNIYQTPHQVDAASARRHAKASTEGEAMSAATRLYVLEKQKPSGKSSAKVAAESNLEFRFPSCLNVKPKATKRLSRLCRALISMLS